MSNQNEKLSLAIEEANEKLSGTIANLIMTEPFFANLLIVMSRNFVTRIPTLGINVTDTVNLYVNPYFFNSFSLKERTEFLKHECYHVLNNHFERFKLLEPTTIEKNRPFSKVVEDMLKANRLNIAADLAINEYLPNLPQKMNMYDENGDIVIEPDVILDSSGNLVKNENAGKKVEARLWKVDNLKKELPTIENLKNTEYYYDILKQEEQKNGGKGPNGATLDDHSLWSEGDQDSEYVTEKIKQIVNGAAEKTTQNAGNLPSDVETLIHKLNYKPKDWRQDLQRFVSRASEILIDSSRKVRNRRYGILFPGYKIFPKLHLAVAVDTSGSISDDELTQFFAEIDRIQKNEVKLTIIEADCTIQNVYEYNPKKAIKASGRGGTAYQPAIDKGTELDIDGMIYFGDMDASDSPKKPKYPVLWAIVREGKPPADWGYTTNVKVRKIK
jgi:predicted metal-dependent peptidase